MAPELEDAMDHLLFRLGGRPLTPAQLRAEIVQFIMDNLPGQDRAEAEAMFDEIWLTGARR